MPTLSRRSLFRRVGVFAGAVRLRTMAQDAAKGAGAGWQSMFDGKSLGSFRETPFRNHGPVTVENGAVVLGAGQPMTGITWRGDPLPTSNYEARFEASRVRGGDFFASLTFPVENSFCTLVTGGWGGDIAGLSSLDGWDASDNETRTYFNFDTGRWYTFHLRVTPDRIGAWIDEKQVINVEIAGRTIALRPGDTKLCAPFGFASYNTTGCVRKVEYRVIRPSAAK